MGLIARQLEESGIPTVTMTSALDITMSVHPPRSVFVDFPLGHTAGRAHHPELNRRIVSGALAAFAEANRPGWIHDQQLAWDDDDSWKESVMSVPDAVDTESGEQAGDDRSARRDTPQYQSEIDAAAAAESHRGKGCVVCKGVDY